jgi:uncharacterized protein YbjQ (UPF0145 family)
VNAFGTWRRHAHIFGSRAKSYENELASGVSVRWRRWSSSRRLGADGGRVDIDYETVGTNMLMVSASGTAVAEQAPRSEPPIIRRRP